MALARRNELKRRLLSSRETFPETKGAERARVGLRRFILRLYDAIRLRSSLCSIARHKRRPSRRVSTYGSRRARAFERASVSARARRGEVTHTTRHTRKHKQNSTARERRGKRATGRVASAFPRILVVVVAANDDAHHHVRVSRRRDGGVVAHGGVGGVPVPAAYGGLVAAVLPLAVLEVGALGLSDAAPEAVGLGRKHEAAAGGAVPVPGAGRGAARAVVVAAAAAAAGVPAAAAAAAPAAAAAVLVPAAAAVLSRARREGESGERVSAREEKRAKRKALPTPPHVGQKKTRRSIWRKRPTAARVSQGKTRRFASRFFSFGTSDRSGGRRGSRRTWSPLTTSAFSGLGVPHLKQFIFDAKTFPHPAGHCQSPGRTLPPPPRPPPPPQDPPKEPPPPPCW